MAGPRKARKVATATWSVTMTENGPGVQGRKARAGSIHVRATDGVRVINADLMPDEAATFDPERHWQLIIGQSPMLLALR
jgi:hypothetical protein